MNAASETERASKRDAEYRAELERIANLPAKDRFGKLAIRRGDRVTEWGIEDHELDDDAQ